MTPQACAEIQRLAEAWVDACFNFGVTDYSNHNQREVAAAKAAFTRALAAQTERILALEAENQRMREALEFYAYAVNWTSDGTFIKADPTFSQRPDCGETARLALLALRTRPTQAQEKQDE